MDYENNVDNDNNILINVGTNCNLDCIKPKVRRLEPVLVTKIYYQPIIEEMPHSAIQVDIENNTIVADAHSKPRPPYCNI